ncbi:MAG: hypothetical protein V8R52_07480 [Coprobacter fastidiosus]
MQVYNSRESPLYIVDGFPVNSIGKLPSDIKDMRVLKDAASTAIYGTRGANGVILITTKEGTEGKITVDSRLIGECEEDHQIFGYDEPL